MSPPALRVAIVGLGPKGLFALERLLDRAGDAGCGLLVDVFEAHPVPGAGPNYDPAQPAFLRMNFPAGQIDIWRAFGSTVVPAGDRRDFCAWSRDRGQPCSPGSYPARADVGRYLACGLATLLRHAPPGVTVLVHRTRVQAVRPAGRLLWEVCAGDHHRHGPFDEVLLATGHERPGGTGGAVFPVAVELSRARVPPGATVAVRGFALTFIDAALALTEGRGATFEPLAHPYRLRYVPAAGDAVRAILPFSRSGRPMLAKPGARGPAELDEIGRRGRERLTALGGPAVSLERDLLPLLAATGGASLRATRGVGGRPEQLAAWLAGAAAGRPVAASRGPAAELERSLAVGAGLAPTDLSWALGHTWRALYPALVARLGHGGLAPSDWPAFRRLAGALERVSFGPSPANAAKLLALIDAGVVDLRHVAGGVLDRRGRRMVLGSAGGRGPVPIDVVVDAVLPGPGADRRSPVLGELIAGGHLHVPPGRRGLDVDVDGGCRRADGSPTIGLSAVGRPTEDTVIGNDTLNPGLHDLADRWAGRVVARALDAAAPSEALSSWPR